MKSACLLAVGLLYACSGSHSEADYELLAVKQGEKWGYINAGGEYVINPQFDRVTPFSEGRARVLVNGKYGFIDKEGRYVVNPTYSDATVFTEGVAWVVSPKGAPTLIDTDGDVLCVLKDVRRVYNFSEGMAVAVKDDGTIRAVDKEGKTVVEFPDDLFFEFNFIDGLALVKNTSLEHGYMDTKGKLAINCQFEEGTWFCDGKAIVEVDGKYGVIDRKGKYVINPQFDELAWDNGRFVMKLGSVVGWCDLQGKILINPQFDMAFPFMEGDLAPVRMDGKFGYIDKSGKLAINPQFKIAFPFMPTGVAWVQSGDKWGLIDEEGRFVVNPQFEDVIMPDGDPRLSDAVSEYFDVEGVVSMVSTMLDGNAFDGMPVSRTSIRDFRKKYDLGEKEVVFTKRHSPDLSYTVTAHGTFTQTVSDGWWGTTTKQLPDAKLDYIHLMLTVQDTGNSKPLYDALVKALGGSNGKRASGQHILMEDYGNGVSLYVSDKPLDAAAIYDTGCGE